MKGLVIHAKKFKLYPTGNGEPEKSLGKKQHGWLSASGRAEEWQGTRQKAGDGAQE